MLSDSLIVIPARMNSKGLPFKNRRLFSITADIVPEQYKNQVLVTSDDPVILKMAQERGFKAEIRPNDLALDTTSTKAVLSHLQTTQQPSKHIITLYLTYPERTWTQVEEACVFYLGQSAKSLLCKKEIRGTHPYLYMLESGVNGKQLVEHNLYRRQDYPKVFELSHFVSIIKWNELENLNENLYNSETVFHPIEDVVDIDTYRDLEQYSGKSRLQ